MGTLTRLRSAFRLAPEKDGRPRKLDILMAIVAIGYGLDMAILAVTDARGYNFLDRLNDREIGYAALAVGLVQLWATLRSKVWPRRICAFLMGWHWSAFAAGILLSDLKAPGVVLYAGYALGNLFILHRL